MTRPPSWLFTIVVATVTGLGIALVLRYEPASSAPKWIAESTKARAITSDPNEPLPALTAEEVGETDWLSLMPPEDIAALENLSPTDHYGGDAPGDYRMGSMGATQGLDVFKSFSTVRAMHRKPVKLGGFIVPLSATADNELTEFFLVPYFGACLHTPPPPPNQIVHVVLPKPIPMTDLWAGYWVEGELRVKLFMNDVAGSAYQIADAKVTPWM
jgi:hypothetical protein